MINTLNAYTVCFTGATCTRDEGEVSRKNSDKNIYSPETGYIPIRINLEISGALNSTAPSISVRGSAANDWANNNQSEPLQLDCPLKVPHDLLSEAKRYSGGNQQNIFTEIIGSDQCALALHGANKAMASAAKAYNFIGHSRCS